ncbi:thiol reductase thioredoxin [Allofustis seminis]|uniref:thiol reductase thioredoxin n=1 Tax=Allofustis seminis TaxID=166939 RepID=UPI00035DA3E0|nr:thiol reductase thioredoxin [Allofustis seminis]
MKYDKKYSISIILLTFFLVIDSISSIRRGDYTFTELLILALSSVFLAITVEWIGKRMKWEKDTRFTAIIVAGMLILAPIFIKWHGLSSNSSNLNQQNLESETTSDYRKMIADFSTIESGDLEEKIEANKPFTLYMGRADCPFCEVFVSYLNEASKEIDSKIYYFDSSKATSSEDQRLEDLGLFTVPQLVKIEKGKVIETFNVEEDYTETDIIQFLTP